ncbi:hypothetical protein ACFY9R_26480 [Streptomyces albidoflavus]|uniref:hypothetical protein n=1 Tax=Streptomyces albidoflavus TaxID=1886 RepID=UPI003406327B
MSVTTRTQVIGSVIDYEVSEETFAKAKAGDRDAGASVLFEMEGRLVSLARRASKLAEGDASDGLRDAYTEDLIQEAFAIAWKCLTRYEGQELDAFRGYAFRYVEKELPARARDLLNGTDDDTDGKKLFAQMVKRFREADARHNLTAADYLNMAEAAVQDKGLVATLNGGAYKSRVRMSPEAAAAARLAYQGAVSIYTPTGSEDADTTIADTLAGIAAADEDADVAVVGYRPIQWVQAVHALEATVRVPRHPGAREKVFTALDRFRAGTVTRTDVEFFESIRCRNSEFGTAVAMLRAVLNREEEGPQESTAEKSADAALGRGSIALNAQRSILEKATEDAVRRALVRLVLATLSQRQAYILAATFGFMGKFSDDAAVARAMKAAGICDIDAARVRKDREKARASFTKKWSDLVAKTGTEAAALEAAAAKQGVDLADALAED